MLRGFKLPPSYRPNSRVVPRLSLWHRTRIWAQALMPGNLQRLQDKLVASLYPEMPAGVTCHKVKVPIGAAGHINEVQFRVENDPKAETRHVVFVHGYGASLGCFARNFSVALALRGRRCNYTLHFLDNVSFGLSLNPPMASLDYGKPIPRVSHFSFRDSGPTDKAHLHKKYYKLVDLLRVRPQEFAAYKQQLTPVLSDMEQYYTGALEAWRQSSGIDQIHTLVGHSFGGYWSGCYALKYPAHLRQLVLLSPVGVERSVAAVTAPFDQNSEASLEEKPSLDPASYTFLSRWPILLKQTIEHWYTTQPYMARRLWLSGPFGVAKYYDMWYGKLYAINKVIARLGSGIFSNGNQLRYGTNSECQLLIEYLYNSITTGTYSDIHVKYLLTPATTSKWPLYDKFAAAKNALPFKTHVVYGEYDFMFAEAGEKLTELIQAKEGTAEFHTVAQGGHNLYIQNPFGTNDLLEKVIVEE